MSKYICPLCGKRFDAEQDTCSRCNGRVWLAEAWEAWEKVIRDDRDNAMPASTPPIDTVTIVIPPDDDKPSTPGDV